MFRISKFYITNFRQFLMFITKHDNYYDITYVKKITIISVVKTNTYRLIKVLKQGKKHASKAKSNQRKHVLKTE